MSKGEPDSGVTLAEIVLALGLLAFGALAVVGVYLALLQSSVKNREQAMAELLTEKLLEQAAAVGPPDWGVGGQTDTRLQADLETDGSRFFYQVNPELVDTRPDSAAGETWRITVTVGWWLDQNAASLEAGRVGFGNQFVKGVRTLYWREGSSG